MSRYNTTCRSPTSVLGSLTFDADGPPSTSASDSEVLRLRESERQQDRVVSSWTNSWLQALPEPLRPRELTRLYPRVANRLALCWSDPALTGRLFDDLLFDKRGKRKGFPKPVAEELMRLRRYHEVHRAVDAPASLWEWRSMAVSDR
jgi:hypothetical protein